MPSRRAFLKMVSPVIIAPALVLPVKARNLDEECEFYANCLAEAMRKRHGGKPMVTINHHLAIAQVIVT